MSIHVNSLPALRDKRVVETYVLGTTTDARLQALAGDENRESGYTLADYRRLLEGVLEDARSGESRRLARGRAGRPLREPEVRPSRASRTTA